MNDIRFDNAVLLIDKPAGRTSFDTIAGVRRLLSIRKIGHSGTLDRFASGLLVVCTGAATKLTRFFLESSKEYVGEVKLGVVTDTCDAEGEIVETRPVEGITGEMVDGVISRYKGKQIQIPPDYSSLKIRGRRASDLVREGKEVSLKGREIEIYGIERLDEGSGEGLFTMRVHCSKGTYIRALARDMGRDLGCGAHLSGLRRISSGGFQVSDAVTPEDLRGVLDGTVTPKNFVISPVEALSSFSLMIVGDEARKRIMNGAFFRREDVAELRDKGSPMFALTDGSGELIAVAHIDLEAWNIQYYNIFNADTQHN